MTDTAAVLLALAAAVGALVARPFPLPLAVGVVVVALAVRRPALLMVGVAVAASALAARSWSGLDPPEPQQLDGVVTLVGDPQNAFGGVKVDVRASGRRVEAWARGREARALRDRLAGERVHLAGSLQAVPETERRRLAPRHVSARLTVERVGTWSAGDPASRLANGVRRTLLGGASSLSRERRSLFAGFVLGDDRDQPPEVAFDFRASGLAHLLVVSGQNVAFVLTVAAPLLRRLRLRGRLVVGVVVLGLFGVLTRWEPSVLRAVFMAGVALLAGTLGRPASTVRVLSLTVAALLVIDPLLVHSIGFRLSVGACAGIAWLSARLAAALPGPCALAETLAVTIAAQAGVAPVMVPIFGGLPVAALIANLLALPAAGPLMVWGLAAGLPAGVIGGSVAALLHVPTSAMVAWVAGVARLTGTLPLGQLGLAHVAALAVVTMVAVVAVRRAWRRSAAIAIAAAAMILLLPAVTMVRSPPVDARTIGRGATLWRAGRATVVVLDGAQGPADRLMSALQAAGVRDLDVLVASRGGRTEARTVQTIRRRFPAGVVLAPPKARLAEALVPPAGSEIQVGGLTVHIEHAGDRLAATVSRGPPDSVDRHAGDAR